MKRWWTLVLVAVPAACGAKTQQAVTPDVGAVVEIPKATPDQLHDFDADKTAPPAASTKSAHTEHRSVYRVDLDEARQQAQRPTSQGGPDCDAAVLCCKNILRHRPGSSANVKVCDAFRNKATSSCRPVLDIFRRAARQTGISCP